MICFRDRFAQHGGAGIDPEETPQMLTCQIPTTPHMTTDCSEPDANGGVAQTLLQRLGSQEEFGAGVQQICLA